MVRLRPSEIRFIQDSIAGRFQDGGLLNNAIDDIVNGGADPDNFPPIRVVKKDNKYYSFDNRRLYIFRVCELRGVLTDIPVKLEPLYKLRDDKFTTQNDGVTIRLRQGPTRNHYSKDWNLEKKQNIFNDPFSSRNSNDAAFKNNTPKPVPQAIPTSKPTTLPYPYSGLDNPNFESDIMRSYRTNLPQTSGTARISEFFRRTPSLASSTSASSSDIIPTTITSGSRRARAETTPVPRPTEAPSFRSNVVPRTLSTISVASKPPPEPQHQIPRVLTPSRRQVTNPSPRLGQNPTPTQSQVLKPSQPQASRPSQPRGEDVVDSAPKKKGLLRRLKAIFCCCCSAKE